MNFKWSSQFEHDKIDQAFWEVQMVKNYRTQSSTRRQEAVLYRAQSRRFDRGSQ